MAVSSAISPSAVARVVGIKTQFLDLRAGNILFLPQRVMLVGQGNTASQGTYSLTKRTVTSASEVASTYGFGSPLHLAAEKLLPVNGDGIGSIPLTVYPLNDGVGAATASGDITPGGTQSGQATYVVVINNIRSQAFTVADAAVVADITLAMTTAINSTLDMPVIASDDTTEVSFVAKWGGLSGNDIYVEIEESVAGANTFTIVQATGGTVDPDPQGALDQVGNVWESMLLSCFGNGQTATLDSYQTFNEGRWLPTVHKPLIAFTGNTVVDPTTASVIPEARKSDRTNSQLVAPGSKNLPCVVAARQLARIVVLANNNPAHDYGARVADTLTPGLDSEQWDNIKQELAVGRGSSTSNSIDGRVEISDVITYYHPDNEAVPAYRFVCDIVKLQQILFNQALIFEVDTWNGAPLIPDDQRTVNRSAKQPKMAKAEIARMIDSLALNALISDPASAKQSIIAEISDQNPKRLDVAWTAQLSGNTNIISIDFNWGFFFGTPAAIN